MNESDLYAPLKQFLESQSYEVKGEVGACDVVAVRGEEPPVVVELKLTINLDVILQAVDRQALTSKVYIGVPRRCRILSKKRKRILKLLRMLGLGLVVIDPAARTEKVVVALDPGEYRPRKSKPRTERLLGEFVQRVGDPNPGGSDRRRGLLTAYRQRALEVARYLRDHGPTKSAHLARQLSEPKAHAIVYDNVYGWFERESRGVYRLSPKGREDVVLWDRTN